MRKSPFNFNQLHGFFIYLKVVKSLKDLTFIIGWYLTKSGFEF